MLVPNTVQHAVQQCDHHRRVLYKHTDILSLIHSIPAPSHVTDAVEKEEHESARGEEPGCGCGSSSSSSGGRSHLATTHLNSGQPVRLCGLTLTLTLTSFTISRTGQGCSKIRHKGQGETGRRTVVPHARG